MHQIDVKAGLLEPNDAIARENREFLTAHGIYAVDIMSAPGSGKTSLLEWMIPILSERYRLAVVEGDIVGNADKERLDGFGVPVHQINTGAACHLDARMVHPTLHRVAEAGTEVLLIENVGNLVCPAAFDLGEAHKIVVLSVTEGEDKPLKYPEMFAVSDLMLINKADLLPHLDFDVSQCIAHALKINPDLQALVVSAKTGEGLPAFYAWIEARAARWARANAPAAVAE